MADSQKKKSVRRRDFLKGSGAVAAAGALAMPASVTDVLAQTPSPCGLTSYPASTGYLVHDSRLCRGCQSCMFACSVTHEGEANLSLSRIQIVKDPPAFTRYPYDIVMGVCRQCASPLCVQNCPTGAAYVDAANGNIRRIDQAKCIGCKVCLKSCPQRPHRPVFNAAKGKAAKCDLCADAPYWSQKGGPTGHQACVETCPAKALKLVAEMPNQEDMSGYDVNLVPAQAVESGAHHG